MSGLIQTRGRVHGKTIALEESIPVGEGEIVELTITRSADRLAESGRQPGDGLRAAFGAWAEDAEDVDEFLEWNRQQRKQSRPEIEL